MGFVFSSPVVEMCGQQRDVDGERVVAALFVAHLADRLEERLALDVTDRAADLDDHDLAPPASRPMPRMRSLISLVTWGMGWMVRPR